MGATETDPNPKRSDKHARVGPSKLVWCIKTAQGYAKYYEWTAENGDKKSCLAIVDESMRRAMVLFEGLPPLSNYSASKAVLKFVDADGKVDHEHVVDTSEAAYKAVVALHFGSLGYPKCVEAFTQCINAETVQQATSSTSKIENFPFLAFNEIRYEIMQLAIYGKLLHGKYDIKAFLEDVLINAEGVKTCEFEQMSYFIGELNPFDDYWGYKLPAKDEEKAQKKRDAQGVFKPVTDEYGKVVMIYTKGMLTIAKENEYDFDAIKEALKSKGENTCGKILTEAVRSLQKLTDDEFKEEYGDVLTFKIVDGDCDREPNDLDKAMFEFFGTKDNANAVPSKLDKEKANAFKDQQKLFHELASDAKIIAPAPPRF